ncbi:serine/threonine-protein kinase [Tautonia plasticadhaerens]|uniref:Serine/threonine-protein kinase StkP n=1 Tax=Tautonia plasticadhaerens TaxID=2527974 RepID=A0A518H2I9_9BACT|nr:serine/threonine-protein kinase [Tautonia plasticadhaerens]QDV35058.1 Serine/threonine-protein kinase StkP [Tautonia plasticadhaerens]
MTNPRDSRFWRDALNSGLIDEKALLACWEAIPPGRRTPEAIDQRLARRAVENGRLTRWQAAQLLSGRPIGFFIGRYALLDLLGQGGMGRVYLARDRRLGRKVALKLLSSRARQNPTAVARFRREAVVGAGLQHDNLVRLYDDGEFRGIPFLVMEYIEGAPLGRLLSEFGPMPPSTASRLARQVALGLGHLHLKGLVHRDVNPWNILVTPDGVAKLADLGLAVDSGDHVALTVDGTTVGTFDYMAPEQARHSRKIDSRSDIYSLGCTLYQMVTGTVPFDRPTLPEKLLAHLSEEPPPPRSLAPDLPIGLEAVILRMIRKDPEDRYPTPSAVVEALDPFVGGIPGPYPHPEFASTASASFESIAPAPAPGSSASVSSSASASASSSSSSSSSSSFSAEDRATEEVFDLIAMLEARRPAGGLFDRAARRVREVGALASLLVAIGALASILLVLLLVLGPPGPGDRPETADADPTPPADPGTLTIRVVLPDGSSVGADDLDEALGLASGGGGRIELGGSGPARLVRSGSLEIARGAVTIAAAPGARPELVPVVAGSRPFIRVRPRARLRLEGLSIRVEAPGGFASPAPLIDSSGLLELSRCAFRVSGPAPGARAVVTDGPGLAASGCWFEGFSPALDLSAFAGFEAELEHCMLIGARSGDPETSAAIRVDLAPDPSDDGARVLRIRDCTVRAPCLLRADDFSDSSPLTVSIERTRVQSRGLLSWRSDSDPTAETLSWSGRDNRYETPGPSLVHRPSPPPGAPRPRIGWEEWIRTWAEPGSSIRPSPLPDAPPGRPGRPPIPDDFPRVVDDGGDPLGADPDRVGPEGGSPSRAASE